MTRSSKTGSGRSVRRKNGQQRHHREYPCRPQQTHHGRRGWLFIRKLVKVTLRTDQGETIRGELRLLGTLPRESIARARRCSTRRVMVSLLGSFPLLNRGMLVQPPTKPRKIPRQTWEIRSVASATKTLSVACCRTPIDPHVPGTRRERTYRRLCGAVRLR